MARKHHDKGRLDPFVPLLIDTLDTPAWRSLSHGAQMLYIALKRRYNRNNRNNGRIFLSQRLAAKELRSNHNRVARWYRELQHYGFIVKHSEGYLGVDGRACAPRWRLTELGYMHEPPTKDYLCWNGRPFEDRKTDPRTGQSKTKSRDSNDARGVPRMEHGNVLQMQHPERTECA